MADRTYKLVPVAFMRSVGGSVRVLFAIDSDEHRVAEGDPVLLCEHRPTQASGELRHESAEVIGELLDPIVELLRHEITRLIESSFDETGSFDGQRMLGKELHLEHPAIEKLDSM